MKYWYNDIQTEIYVPKFVKHEILKYADADYYVTNWNMVECNEFCVHDRDGSTYNVEVYKNSIYVY